MKLETSSPVDLKGFDFVCRQLGTSRSRQLAAVLNAWTSSPEVRAAVSKWQLGTVPLVKPTPTSSRAVPPHAPWAPTSPADSWRQTVEQDAPMTPPTPKPGESRDDFAARVRRVVFAQPDERPADLLARQLAIVETAFDAYLRPTPDPALALDDEDDV